MTDPTAYLTPDNVAKTAKVLQALDVLAENVYNKEHAKEVEPKLKATESDVANLADEMSNNMPAQLLLMDGNGYRMMFTLFTNMLLAVNLRELAEAALEAREIEEP